MKVPYVDLVEHNAPFREEMLAAVSRVLEHGQFILGPEVVEFEDQMAAFIGAEHVVSCSSGTSALTLALRVLGIGEGDEVITCSHSFAATGTSIALVGAAPRFVDIDPATGLMDPQRLDEALRPNTKAVLIVHLGGVPCPMDQIVEFCTSRSLRLVEDCAQAIGAKFGNRSVGTFGIGCFSLHPLKTLSACGDAGFLTTSDSHIASRLKQLRNIGLASRDHLAVIGENARLDTIQAALLLPKAKRLSDFIRRRNEHAADYRDSITAPVQHFVPPAQATPAYSCYAVKVPHRDEVLSALQRRGVDAKVHYPIPIHKHPPFARFADAPLPGTESVVRQILSLPVTPEMTTEQRAYVVETINSVATDQV